MTLKPGEHDPVSLKAGEQILITGPAPLAMTRNSTKTRVRVTAPGTYVPEPTPEPGPAYTFSCDFLPDESGAWTFDTEWGCCGLSAESDLMSGGGVSFNASGMALRVERGTTPSGRPWRSAERATKGTFQQLYGIFQARIKYPKGQGFWPAFWLLDATREGRRAEIDVMEAYPFGTTASRGGGPTQYAMTNHPYDANGNALPVETVWCKPGIDLTLDFHVYEIEWRKDLIVARLDGRDMGRITANVPSVPMFMILDHVVGGWAGLSDATSPSPADMIVDWVRVQA